MIHIIHSSFLPLFGFVYDYKVSKWEALHKLIVQEEGSWFIMSSKKCLFDFIWKCHEVLDFVLSIHLISFLLSDYHFLKHFWICYSEGSYKKSVTVYFTHIFHIHVYSYKIIMQLPFSSNCILLLAWNMQIIFMDSRKNSSYFDINYM